MLPSHLPFYYQSHKEQGNGGFPEILPIDIYFDDNLKMYRQQSSKNLKEILHKVYASGSLVEGSVSSESGKIYVDKVLSFINNVIEVKNKSILELGCGDGTMLIEFQKRGALVVGLEPGNHPKNPRLDNIEIVNDFFPSKKINGQFDIIFHYGVLEHIENPVDFLTRQLDFLKSDGSLVICVPNCEPFLETGDLSIFIHEHYNYFSRESFSNTLHASGLAVDKLAIIEGMIVALVTKKINKGFIIQKKFNQNTFLSLFENFQTKISTFLSKYPEQDVAIYVPLRALNILYTLKVPGLRLVDDSKEITGKYLPYFTNPVESFTDIVEKPPKSIIIFSRTFGDRIKKRCRSKKELNNSDIIIINEL